MLYRTHIPRPPLSDFVELFWLYEGYDPPQVMERVIPTGTMQLIFNLREDELRVYDRQDHNRFQSFGGCLISGAHSEFVVIDTASQASTMGVHFKPGGAHPFLGLPASELRDADVPLDALWGTKAIELRDRLLEAETPEAGFGILEQALLAQLARPLTHHPAVALALNEYQSMPRTRTVKEVSEQTGLSQRRFIQLFREEVGLTPKLFRRIWRFQDHPSHRKRGACRVGGRGSILWLLRPGALHPRLPGLHRYNSYDLSGSTRRASQPHPNKRLDSAMGQFFTIDSLL